MINQEKESHNSPISDNLALRMIIGSEVAISNYKFLDIYFPFPSFYVERTLMLIKPSLIAIYYGAPNSILTKKI